MALLNTQEKKFSWGGRSLFAKYPAHGAVSIVGSVSGGDVRMGSEELAKVHAAMLMEGTKSHSKKEIQQMLDAMGATLSLYPTATRLGFSARVRTPHLEQLLALISEILREPAFPQGELALLKKREEAALALEAQDTRAQAGIYMSRMLYKKGHPNWSETTEESLRELKKISSKQLHNVHNKIISRRELVVSMAGDSTAQTVHQLIEKYFKSLPDVRVPKVAFAKAPAPAHKSHSQPIEHKVNIDYMVGIATHIDANHAEYPALMLGIQVLGCWGGFTGRLMRTVREIEGLTYNTYAQIAGATANRDGNVLVWSGFAVPQFEQGKNAVMREIKSIVEDGVTDEEARKHCEMYIARTKVGLSNSGAFASAAHNLAVDGRTMSYLDEFNKKISKLTAKQINRALKKYLIPSKLSESSAGPSKRSIHLAHAKLRRSLRSCRR